LLCSQSDSGPLCPEGYVCDSDIVTEDAHCQPAIPLGQQCQVHHDFCGSNSYCQQAATKTDVGTCVTLPKAGEKCSTEAKFPCVLGYTCLLDDTKPGMPPTTCVKSPRSAGELCTFATKCVPDTYCQYKVEGKATGRCTPFGRINQPCDGGFASGRLCSSGLGCYVEDPGKPGVCLANESGPGAKCSPSAGLICDRGRAYCKILPGKRHGICTPNVHAGEPCGRVAGSKVHCAHGFGCLRKKDGTGTCANADGNAIGARCQAGSVECVDEAYCPVTLQGEAVCTTRVAKGEKCGGDKQMLTAMPLEHVVRLDQWNVLTKPIAL